MMDFSRFGSKLKTKVTKSKPIKVEVFDSIWYANVNGKKYPINLADLSCKGIHTMYSRLPENDWKATTIFNPITDDVRIEKINQSWCRLRPGLIVKGSVINNIFYVSEVVTNNP